MSSERERPLSWTGRVARKRGAFRLAGSFAAKIEVSMDALARHGLEPDPVIEAFKKDVDRSLLRENLKLTVEQRIRRWLDHLRWAEELREAGRRARSTEP